MKTLNTKQNNLGAYLTAGLGAGCLAGNADAATVQIYGEGAAPPAGIAIGRVFGFYAINIHGGAAAFFKRDASFAYFTDGADLGTPIFGGQMGVYWFGDNLLYGAVSGEANFANISFDGDDGLYESVGQFYLDGYGDGYLMAIAKNLDGSALSISEGKAAIDAVPEPSSLGLLALGAAGLMARRRRRIAA